MYVSLGDIHTSASLIQLHLLVVTFMTHPFPHPRKMHCLLYLLTFIVRILSLQCICIGVIVILQILLEINLKIDTSFFYNYQVYMYDYRFIYSFIFQVSVVSLSPLSQLPNSPQNHHSLIQQPLINSIKVSILLAAFHPRLSLQQLFAKTNARVKITIFEYLQRISVLPVWNRAVFISTGDDTRILVLTPFLHFLLTKCI